MFQILSEGSYSSKKIRIRFGYKIGYNQWLQLQLKTIKIAIYFKNLIIGFHILNLLTRMSNFVSIECYLLSDL